MKINVLFKRYELLDNNDAIFEFERILQRINDSINLHSYDYDDNFVLEIDITETIFVLHILDITNAIANFNLLSTGISKEYSLTLKDYSLDTILVLNFISIQRYINSVVMENNQLKKDMQDIKNFVETRMMALYKNGCFELNTIVKEINTAFERNNLSPPDLLYTVVHH